MDRCQGFYRLALHHNLTSHNYVDAVATLQMHAFVVKWQWTLLLKRYFPNHQLSTQTCMIRRFKQSGAKGTMNFNGRANDLMCQLIQLVHVSVHLSLCPTLRSLCLGGERQQSYRSLPN